MLPAVVRARSGFFGRLPTSRFYRGVNTALVATFPGETDGKLYKLFCVGKWDLILHSFLAGSQRARFHAVSINLPLQEEDGREPRGKFRRFLQPRKTHRHLDPLKVCLCPAIRMLAVTGVNWGCLQGCQHDLRVPLKSQVIKAFQVVNGMFKAKGILQW